MCMTSWAEGVLERHEMGDDFILQISLDHGHAHVVVVVNVAYNVRHCRRHRQQERDAQCSSARSRQVCCPVAVAIGWSWPPRGRQKHIIIAISIAGCPPTRAWQRVIGINRNWCAIRRVWVFGRGVRDFEYLGDLYAGTYTGFRI